MGNYKSFGDTKFIPPVSKVDHTHTTYTHMTHVLTQGMMKVNLLIV